MYDTYEFTLVNALNKAADASTLSFYTDGGVKLIVSVADSTKARIDFLTRSAAERTHVFAAYNPATGKFSFVSPFIPDSVKSIRAMTPASNDLVVTLVLRPSLLRLSAANPRFGAIRRVLEAAQQNRTQVWLGSFPGDMEILDARLP
ncbi:MAG: hypothetical protein KF778_06215 [Rhodocyclaceae bacterium]|nr:hypothetical protein [Rhodocyclaceae bacterium]MBX3667981.1 hypothetical protein [Rhodocyclaceae bacterium]